MLMTMTTAPAPRMMEGSDLGTDSDFGESDGYGEDCNIDGNCDGGSEMMRTSF